MEDYGAGDKYRDFGELFSTSHDGAQIKYTLDLDTKGIKLIRYIILFFRYFFSDILSAMNVVRVTRTRQRHSHSHTTA